MSFPPKEIPFGQIDTVRIYGVQLHGRTDRQIVDDLHNAMHQIRNYCYSSIHLVGRSTDIPETDAPFTIVGEKIEFTERSGGPDPLVERGHTARSDTPYHVIESLFNSSKQEIVS